MSDDLQGKRWPRDYHKLSQEHPEYIQGTDQFVTGLVWYVVLLIISVAGLIVIAKNPEQISKSMIWLVLLLAIAFASSFYNMIVGLRKKNWAEDQ